MVFDPKEHRAGKGGPGCKTAEIEAALQDGRRGTKEGAGGELLRMGDG